MSILLLLLAVLGQDGGCAGAPVRTALEEAAARVEQFDLRGAADRFAMAAERGCADARVSAQYLDGLLAARAAYRQGGTEASLEPVRQAIARLEALAAATGSAPARIAGVVLRAAVAAAQSEREEMAIVLEHATALERLQLLAGEPGAPVLSALEVAGDLWLQVHRHEDAAQAYARAAAELGATPFVRLGAARSAARMNDAVTACREYAAVVRAWGGRPEEPDEIAEARVFLHAECQSAAPAPNADGSVPKP